MNILCYGDSNTYGYNPADGMRYPADVRWTGVLRKLAPEHTIIEEGCNGRTAAFTPEDEPWKDGRGYLKACLNSHKPLDLVILMLGSNDLKSRFRASPEEISEGIRWILQTTGDFLQEKQGFRPRALLIAPAWIGEGITSSPFADSFAADAVLRSQRLAGLYRRIAEDLTKAGVLQCDFMDAAEVIRASALDSLHLMPEAHEALARAILEHLYKMEGKNSCRYCNACAPCPSGLDIGRINRLYDLARAGNAEQKLEAEHEYRALEHGADECTGCGRCNFTCPYQVEQAARMGEICRWFG